MHHENNNNAGNSYNNNINTTPIRTTRSGNSSSSMALFDQRPFLLIKLVQLGRSCPSLRDEIYAPHIRLIRGNTTSSLEKLWRSLLCCCAHFPCSEEFENYFESFLLLEHLSISTEEEEEEKKGNGNGNESGHLEKKGGLTTISDAFLPHRCMRLLHESVFLYGYTLPIKSYCKLDFTTMSKWLDTSTATIMPDNYPTDFDPSLDEDAPVKITIL